MDQDLTEKDEWGEDLAPAVDIRLVPVLDVGIIDAAGLVVENLVVAESEDDFSNLTLLRKKLQSWNKKKRFWKEGWKI